MTKIKYEYELVPTFFPGCFLSSAIGTCVSPNPVNVPCV